VLIAPPFEGAETSVILGTLESVTSPSPIIGPALSRMLSILALSAVSASSASRLSCPVRPKSSARITTIGIPLSIRVQPMPSIWSASLPVGKSAPHMEPAMFWNRSRTGAWVPGTPSMAALPA
jgi:hypothetical protein